MNPTSDNDRLTSIRAFILSLDVPETVVKAAAKVLQPRIKETVKDDLKEHVPEILKWLSHNDVLPEGALESLQGALESLPEFGGELASEIVGALPIPLLNLLLSRVKAAAVVSAVRESENRLHAHLDRIGVQVESLRVELLEELRRMEGRISSLMEDQFARLNTRDFQRAVYFANTALLHPRRSPEEREGQIEELKEAIRYLTTVEADVVNDASAEDRRFLISLLLGLCALRVPSKKWMVVRKLSEVLAMTQMEISISIVKIEQLKHWIHSEEAAVKSRKERMDNSIQLAKTMKSQNHGFLVEFGVSILAGLTVECGKFSVSGSEVTIEDLSLGIEAERKLIGEMEGFGSILRALSMKAEEPV